MSKIFQFKQEMLIPFSHEEVFTFFSKAQNLEKVTPPQLSFKIKTKLPIKMQKGSIIDYQIKLFGLPFNWRSEISVWEPPYRFVDAQLKGPYKKWVHLHEFEQKNNGTLMRDIVDYELFVQPVAPIVNALFVRRQIEAIFRYRTEQLDKIFEKNLINES